ncbi:tripartite tricarboxylate transporter TctB family protein [Micrococcus terreus]|uniref:tripartite tricarboxylate transporter TctB family protein n=1 Tax=Micrococcus terreus TaxID=574650 RepID=UPI0033F1CB73
MHESPPGAQSAPEPSSDNSLLPAHLISGLVVALALAGVGIFAIVEGLSYGLGDSENIIGPGTAPVTLGGLLLAGSLSIGAREAYKLRQGLKASPTSSGINTQGAREYLLRSILVPILIVALFGAGIYASQYIGLFIALSATVLACGLLIERMSLLKSAILAAATMLIGFVLFDVLLSVRFPSSTVGF